MRRRLPVYVPTVSSLLLTLLAAIAFGAALSAPRTAATPSPGPHALPAGPMAEPGAISPDGRRLAFFRPEHQGRDRLVMHDLASGKGWGIDGGRSDGSEYVLTWRPDSQVLAAGCDGGWMLVWPASRKVRWLRRLPAQGPEQHRSIWESCAAWAPRTGRLATFEGEFGDGRFRIWDGTRQVFSRNWPEALGLPAMHGPWRAWDCEWSPDEKAISLRFYGHAERDADAPGHLVVLDPATGRRKGRWGAEAAAPRWLDRSTLVFLKDTGWPGGMPFPLWVANPALRAEHSVMENVLTWSIPPRRDVVYAVTTDNAIRAMGVRDRKWRTLCRLNREPAMHFVVRGKDLVVSARGDLLALPCREDGSAGRNCVAVVETATGRTEYYPAPKGDVVVLGWAAGRRAPIVAAQAPSDGPWAAWQL